ncbi:hypothetical protein [Hydrogenophaga electricum]|uniref:Uncharacterized protein n=1 Tax=Hydrogenophaga electricum TaxID=1230953 RepID=A0ABQ6C373_9BURK|nr:hypothetical protein [Hydrogenophaga electricum]GLS14360.1 hypothetical protein GCM10007935_17910 [Hydrogenophaga electricum]
MTTDLNPYRGIDLRPLRSRLAGWSGFESTLLDTAKLANLARKLGLGHFNTADIRALWRIGLVRADITIGQAPAQIPGLEPVQSAFDVRFIDVRQPKARPTGSPSFVPEGEAAEDALTPYFHPYRIYLLHHVVRTLGVSTSNMQYLLWTPGVLSVVEWHLRSLNHWTESKAFLDRFDHWNWACELSIVCEPARWTRRETDNGDPEKLWLQEYGLELQSHLCTLPEDAVPRTRKAFALAAGELDPNSRLQTLLRLMRRFERDRVEGRIGAAIRLLDMAESIRRAVERHLSIQLPEEDEIGARTWMDGARKILYGTNRVFDAAPSMLRDFLGSFGLDGGVKARCYVEGQTELGALRHVLGSTSQCVVVNLRGAVVEGGGKGLAFVESLGSDKANGIFSFVMLDADQADVVRTLCKAATEETFHGAFLLSNPDIEMANFAISELLDVALGIAARNETPDNPPQSYSREDLLRELDGARSGKEFFMRLHRDGRLREVDKGEDWGAALMAYAIEHQKLPQGDPRGDKERPIIGFAQMLIRAEEAGFLNSLKYERVDSATGRLTRRS